MRVLVVWCPDWPVVAALSERGGEGVLVPGVRAPGRSPVAVLTRSAVVACNDAARAQGVRRGMRRRDAQARCPELVLLPDNPDRDVRAFEPVLAAVEALRPGVAPLRPGLLAIRAPGRFYGGEENAAATVAERLVSAGVWDCRIGIADDLFCAEQAARSVVEPQGWRVVPAGGSAAFLAPLPVGVLDTGGSGEAELVGLLQRLGIDSLGAFAGLPAREVTTRFGGHGAQLHRLAGGADQVGLAARTPPPELVAEVAFEPPLASVEAVCFSVRRTAEELTARLGELGLVATGVRVEAEADDADRTLLSSRSWLHSRWFTPVDLVDRVHWQLQAQGEKVLGAPVGAVRFLPESVEPAADHAEGLWGGGADELVDRGVARVQALLGYDAVRVPVRQGGRAPVERQQLVPWGEKPTGLRPADLPWPGSVPAPAPTRVFAEPWPTTVQDHAGLPVRLTDRGAVTGEPERFRIGTRADAGWSRVEAWAGPWPVDERWWDASAPGLVARFQVVGPGGRAWLMRCDGDTWMTEAGYE